MIANRMPLASRIIVIVSLALLLQQLGTVEAILCYTCEYCDGRIVGQATNCSTNTCAKIRIVIGNGSKFCFNFSMLN